MSPGVATGTHHGGWDWMISWQQLGLITNYLTGLFYQIPVSVRTARALTDKPADKHEANLSSQPYQPSSASRSPWQPPSDTP
ncbi:hypothetical protein FKM82_011862 [Ascaphus truei]